MIKICGIVTYNGTRFFGWERQPAKISVQGEIEKVLSKIFDTKIVTKVAGRTDKGVHAFKQVFTFFLNKECKDFSKLKYAVNRLLPDDIKIIEFKEVDLKFDPKIHAERKEYEYRIYLGDNTPFYKDYCEITHEKIDIKKINEIKDIFLGEHNFKNYTINKEDSKKFIRHIFLIKTSLKDDIIFINIFGDGFMRYMVRFIVGDLILYSQEKIDKKSIEEKLKGKKHNFKIYKASPNGLYLKEIFYNEKN